MKLMAVVALAGSVLMVGVCSGKTELGIDGTRFTINGEATFLTGISFYGALGASKENIGADLDDMQRYGFNWFRMWATWGAFDNSVSAVDAAGGPRQAYLDKLKWLVGECDRRGMVVDVTLSRGNGVTGPERLQSDEALMRAAKTLATSLKEYRNWYLDMGNERSIKDKRYVSIEQLGRMSKAIKKIDADRLVTASFTKDVDAKELGAIVLDSGVDFLAPHRPRNAKSAAQTADQTKRYMTMMNKMGRVIAVHYQEPFRRGFSPGRWEPGTEDFLADLEGALAGGAAGWCLHNGDQKDKDRSEPRRSFDMRKKRLFEQLDVHEMKVVRRIKAVVGAAGR